MALEIYEGLVIAEGLWTGSDLDGLRYCVGSWLKLLACGMLQGQEFGDILAHHV